MDNVPSFIHRVNNRRTRISLPRIGFPRINDFGPTITATEPPAQVFISVDTDDWRWTVYRALPHGERRNILQHYLAAPVRREQHVGLSDSVQLWIKKRQYMNFANFIILLERTIRNAGGAGVELNQLASTIAQPTEGLLSSYASIAAKVAREETLQGARELWELAQSDAAFRSRLSMLHCRLMAQSGSVPVPCQQVRSRLHYLHTNISMSLKTVIDEVERAGDAAINPLFICWLDVSITGALLYIPVVGPALSDVHNNLFAGLKKLVLDMAASRAPQDSVAFASRAPAEAVAGVFAATTSHITSGLSQASSTFSAASQRLIPRPLASDSSGVSSAAQT